MMQRPTNYKIQFVLLDGSGRTVKEGTIIAKNKASKFEALAGTEKYLVKKYPGAVKMTAINVQQETILGYMPNGIEDLFRRFGP
jgi:hypothetical protein